MAFFSRNNSPALLVLTQCELLHHISDFMSGVPFAVGAFAAQEAKRAAKERKELVTALYPQPRGYLPQLAIIRDDLKMLELLFRVSQQPEHARNPRLEFYEVIRCAVMFNKLNALQWIGTHCNLAAYEFEGNLLNYAIHYSGHVAVLDWLHVHVPRQFVHIRSWQLCFAASRGNLQAIRWLHEHDYEGFSAGVMDAAAIAGHLDVVQYLHEHRSEGCTYEAMDMAAANGHFEIVRFLHEKRTEGCTTVAMGCAAGFGHDEVVEFLGKHRMEGPHPRALEDAAKNGHLECVKLLCRYSSRGCLFQARKGAAKMKHQDIVEYLSSIMEDNVWSCNPRRHEGATMDFEALFPPLAPPDEAVEQEFSSVDISVDDIKLLPLEKAVDDGIYRALRRWNEGDSALTDKALPYAERIKKYQRIAALTLQPDGTLNATEDEEEEATESEEEQPEETDRAAVVAKEKAAIAALRRQKKERRKLQKELEEERVRCDAVFQELNDIEELRAERVPSERLQTFVDTFKIKKRRLVQKRSVADTVTAMSFEFARPMPNEEGEEEANKVKEMDAPKDNDPILWFDVLHPSKDPAKTQSFLVRRSQRIAELVDLIACANDERLSEHAKASKLLYFGQNFFVDRRVAGSLDYSEQIVRWIRAKSERQTKYGALVDGDGAPRSLHSSTFADLKLQVDIPGVYIHQGECEHLVRLRDARLPHELDAPKSDGIFPLRLPNLLNHPLRNCLICQHYSAKYVCYGDRLAVVDPMFFCDRCYRTAHYDTKGNLLYNDFLSFPFVQD
ncbi:SnRNA-activating protein complex subunit 3 [Phytophthora palmivora]|uniref:snRNA-activating protein complex subunit 3 n=1 Tax=Phytophthora palmivora TaxID=4796 RepID=A0A2P4YUG8_9STRA|nr:SnRNA-activating protein complex subunit 3 [Phytophthora palmivora]